MSRYFWSVVLFVILTGGLQGKEYIIQEGDTLFSIAEEQFGDEALWAAIADKNDLQANAVLEVGATLDLPDEEELQAERPFGLEIFAYIGVGIVLTWLLYYLFFKMSIKTFQMEKLEQYRYVLTSCKLSMIWLFALGACFIVFESDLAYESLITSVILILTLYVKTHLLKNDVKCSWKRACSLVLMVTMLVNLSLVSVLAFFLLKFLKG